MIDRGRHSVLGVRICAVDYAAAVEKIVDSALNGNRCTTSALAVHGVMTGALDHHQLHRLNSLDLVVPDGQPVRWALGLLHGVWLPDRVYGPNLTLRVLERVAEEGLPVYLYGSRPATLELFERNLRARLPNLRIAGMEPSRFRHLSSEEALETVRRIRASGARLVLVGLGCPRQEVFAFEMGDALSMPVLAVGAAFDFHAGTVRQAPPIIQRMALEWAFRLWQEPARLWRRYLYLNPLYVGFVLLQRVGLLALVVKPSQPPETIQRFG